MSYNDSWNRKLETEKKKMGKLFRDEEKRSHVFKNMIFFVLKKSQNSSIKINKGE